MLKKACMVVALVLTLSTGIMATDKTMIEESWERYISTPKAEYEQNKGRVEIWTGAGVSLSEEWEYGGANFVYSAGSIEVRALVTGDRYVSYDPQGVSEETESLLQGSIKGKVYDRNGFTLAVRGGVAHSRGENAFVNSKTNTYAVEMYAAKHFNNKLTVFNNVGTSFDGNVRVLNGIEYNMNDRHGMKARVQTRYNGHDKKVDVNLSAALKSQLTKDTTNLLMVSAPGDLKAIYLGNTIETKFIHNMLVSGQINVERTDELNAHFGVNAEKTIGIVTLKAGMEHNFPKRGAWRIATIKAGVEVDVTKNLEFVIDVENEKWYYPDVYGYNDPSAIVSLNYKL